VGGMGWDLLSRVVTARREEQMANVPVGSSPLTSINGSARFALFDSATLYEAAGQKGMVDPTIQPAWSGARVCGFAVTVECPPGDNLMLHVAVADAPPGVVIVANVCSYLLAGAWGEILTAAAQARGIAGLAIDGAVRDVDAIREAGFPVFSRGRAIGSCTKERCGRIGMPIQFGGTTVRPGDLILGDADGLVVVDQERLDEVYDTAVGRRGREAQIIDELRIGRTTMELLGLIDPRIHK
jgi:4-hydroxy-4-methyl-2-oxoglutarate aldolase